MRMSQNLMWFQTAAGRGSAVLLLSVFERPRRTTSPIQLSTCSSGEILFLSRHELFSMLLGKNSSLLINIKMLYILSSLPLFLQSLHRLKLKKILAQSLLKQWPAEVNNSKFSGLKRAKMYFSPLIWSF